MNDIGQTVTFVSCFKCGRIVRSTDEECPRCGTKFGPGTLFECPFCAGLVWRSAESCSTCKTDLVKFAEQIGDGLKNFSMDGFVDEILETELENVRRGARRVACPSCGLMIRGDEEQCPRCDLRLRDAKVDCPVCGEKVPINDQSCWNCGTVFTELTFGGSEDRAKEILETIKEKISEEPDKILADDDESKRIREIVTESRSGAAREKPRAAKQKAEKPKKKKLRRRKKK